MSEKLDQYLQEVGEKTSKSSNVVDWYSHPELGQIRGPYMRWFQCSGGNEKYTASISDDVEYCTMAMNEVPKLLEALKIAIDGLNQFKAYSISVASCFTVGSDHGFSNTVLTSEKYISQIESVLVGDND